MLAPIYGFDGISKLSSTPRLHLDESNQSLALDNEVDIAVPAPKSPLNDAPSLPPEPTLRDSLTELAELLPGR